MYAFICAYLAYNLVTGILLCIIRLAQNGTLGSVRNWLLLLFFPAIGLGYMRFEDQNLNNLNPDYPESWFMWTYMKKVNWGFILVQVIAIVLFFLSFSLGSYLGLDGLFTDAEHPFEIGFGLLIGMGVVLMFLVILLGSSLLFLIQAFILIYIPSSQIRRIEKKQLQQFHRSQHSSQVSTNHSRPMNKPIPLYSPVASYVELCESGFDSIPKERRNDLERVAEFLSGKLENGDSVNLMFICTHNSRRSQFGQVWAAVAAAHFGIRNVQTFSGGTEETAFNKRAVESIQRAGLKVEGTVSTNPRYSIRFSDEVGALDCYSKTFDTPANPQKGFVAIMTCSDADEACPIVNGADFRARITYEDPKVADRTAQEKEVYDERCKQIATEMLYLFSKVS